LRRRSLLAEPGYGFGADILLATTGRDAGANDFDALRVQFDPEGESNTVVVSCAVAVSRIHRWELTPIQAGTEIRRAYKTIMKGKPERLLWSDNNVQATLSSKFPGGNKHERCMAMETDEDQAL